MTDHGHRRALSPNFDAPRAHDPVRHLPSSSVAARPLTDEDVWFIYIILLGRTPEFDVSWGRVWDEEFLEFCRRVVESDEFAAIVERIAATGRAAHLDRSDLGTWESASAWMASRNMAAVGMVEQGWTAVFTALSAFLIDHQQDIAPDTSARHRLEAACAALRDAKTDASWLADIEEIGHILAPELARRNDLAELGGGPDPGLALTRQRSLCDRAMTRDVTNVMIILLGRDPKFELAADQFWDETILEHGRRCLHSKEFRTVALAVARTGRALHLLRFDEAVVTQLYRWLLATSIVSSSATMIDRTHVFGALVRALVQALPDTEALGRIVARRARSPFDIDQDRRKCVSHANIHQVRPGSKEDKSEA